MKLEGLGRGNRRLPVGQRESGSESGQQPNKIPRPSTASAGLLWLCPESPPSGMSERTHCVCSTHGPGKS